MLELPIFAPSQILLLPYVQLVSTGRRWIVSDQMCVIGDVFEFKFRKWLCALCRRIRRRV